MTINSKKKVQSSKIDISTQIFIKQTIIICNSFYFKHLTLYILLVKTVSWIPHQSPKCLYFETEGVYSLLVLVAILGLYFSVFFLRELMPTKAYMPVHYIWYALVQKGHYEMVHKWYRVCLTRFPEFLYSLRKELHRWGGLSQI